MMKLPLHQLPIHFALLCFGSLALPQCTRESQAQTGYLPVVIATGELRQQLQATPIELRPNRPFHFYGNAVRRNYYQSLAANQAAAHAHSSAYPPAYVAAPSYAPVYPPAPAYAPAPVYPAYRPAMPATYYDPPVHQHSSSYAPYAPYEYGYQGPAISYGYAPY